MRRVVVAIGLLLPAAAPAWSGPAHRIIGEIAEERLTPEARKLVVEIVGDVSLSDTEIASWADTLRNRRSRTWHYVNVPFAAGRYDAERDCRDGDCIVAAIERFAGDLSESKSHMRQADALRWIVHLVADIHQPLHAGDPWDRGGSTFRVRMGRRRQPTTLHRIWDDDVVKPVVRRHGSTSGAARALSAATTPADAARWTTELSAARWATESSQEARAIYADLDRRPTDTAVLRLPADYVAAQQARVERQLQRAGIRLAALLDRIARQRRAGRPAGRR
jgi:hypothetical protein